jgi:hypothetical protein
VQLQPLFIVVSPALPQIFDPNSSNVYGEVNGAQLLLGYRCQNAGCCKILLHPKWGSAVYPASFFTKAPLEVVKEIISAKFQ